MKNKIDNSVLITLIIVSGVLILGAMVFMFVNYTVYAKTVSSNGMATIKVFPDLVGIYFNIQNIGMTSSEASEKNSEIYDKMKNFLLILGIDKDNIQTESFSVYPEYDWSTGQQKINKYIATHSVKVEILIDDKEKISDVLDAGINAGAGISYINYELTDENQNKYKVEAIKLATEDARTKAEALALGSGGKLGSLVSVSTSDFGYVPWIAFAESDIAKVDIREIETRITPSDQEISSTVTAVFRIR
ncbi:MAG: SIMPL domain-containing protein [Nanoarchaeota archaeon]